VNPLLYANPVPSSFHDITQGTNDPTGNIGGYPAGVGWDACTGLGSPDGVKIFNSLQPQPVPVPAQLIAQTVKAGTGS
jgi:kumamolisin